MSKVVGLAVLVVASLLLLATGCGSDAEDGGTTDTTETAGGSERLTTEQWGEYEAVAAPLEAASAEAAKKLDVCVGSADDADQLATCVGDSFSTLADATAAYASTLETFQGTVAGACADALAEVLNYARPLQATAEEMQTVIDEGDLAAYPGVSSNLEVVATGGKEEKTAFEASCKPA
jgi:ABC-type transporter Mla subunit MlaD